MNALTKRPKEPLKKFLDKHVLGKLNYYIAGHNHFMQYEGIDKGTVQYTSGAGGTPEKAPLLGYLTMLIEESNKKLSITTMIQEIQKLSQSNPKY
jgi:hypothetical protein